jgi:hypothetical protein
MSLLTGIFECIGAAILTVFEVVAGAIECVFVGTSPFYIFPLTSPILIATVLQQYSVQLLLHWPASVRSFVAGTSLTPLGVVCCSMKTDTVRNIGAYNAVFQMKKRDLGPEK